MFDYKPQTATVDPSVISPEALGWLQTEFEAFEPNPKYSFAQGQRRPPCHSIDWGWVSPKHAPPVGELPLVIRKMIKSTWKATEPKAGATRGNVMMGTHGMPQSLANVVYGGQTYHPQVRPSLGIEVKMMNDDAIATDWKLTERIPRDNACTFRGDSRTPYQIICQANGFHPPDTRTDRYYLENAIYNGFSDYFKRRYNREITQADFLQAIDTTMPSPTDKNMFIDYMMWRSLMEKEASHLGRMTVNECLKGYVSTSISIDTASFFAGDGWIYIVVVHGGFVVPYGSTKVWETPEAEIAQWGPIPSERIVGFRKFDYGQPSQPKGPVFIRRSFRKKEQSCFEHVFNIMSGAVPSQL
jgi:hypothetical protein